MSVGRRTPAMSSNCSESDWMVGHEESGPGGPDFCLCPAGTAGRWSKAHPPSRMGGERETNARDYGHLAEAAAAELLTGRGYRLVAANYRCRAGEVDLIAWDGPVLVFVEVKARRREAAGAPIEAIDGRKLRRLRAVAGHYLATHFRGGEPPCRFDAVVADPGPGGMRRPGGLSLIRGIS